jgi:hypothetical protein
LRAVSPAGVQLVVAAIIKIPTPDDHFSASPHCCVRVSASWRVGGAGSCPTVRARIVSPADVEIGAANATSITTPDDHFTASPDCRLQVALSGGVGGAGGCPTVRAGVVSSAGIQPDGGGICKAAPDDHFTASPNCREISSCGGRVGGAGGYPAIRAGIVPPASIQ